jgi:antitoxin (DNA-binding transcriptional repressor) of toxin-antitoxin stability system
MSTLTVSEAKAKFGQLAERALRTGKPVVIRHKGRLIQIARHLPAKPDRFFPLGSLKVTKRQLELDKLAGPDLGPDSE